VKTILFKIQQFPHLSETFIINQIVTAIKCGFDVKILVTDVLDFKDTKLNNQIEEYALEQKIIIENYAIPSNKIVRLLKWALLFLKHLTRLKQIIKFYKLKPAFSLVWLYQLDFYKKFEGVEVIHVQYGTNVHPLDLLKKINFIDSKLIVSFHGHDAFFPINGFIPNNGYYDDLFKYGDLIVANTPYLADEIKNLGCPVEKLKTIPVGVDTDYFHPKPTLKSKNDQLKLITVGRLDKVKGHQYAIEIVDRLVKNKALVSLTIVGEGKERENLEKLIQAKMLQKTVTLTGRKSQEEIREFFWNHDLYILCAVPVENQRRETQGLATLEAQACGLPVIAFDSGGVKYTIKEGSTGYLVPEMDIDGFVEIIQKLQLSKDRFIEISEAATVFAKYEFSLKKLKKKWEVLYNT
jgi:colanic acid/amylovoran biosynthesis glycosyltransferase